jgi:hypothetical protein
VFNVLEGVPFTGIGLPMRLVMWPGAGTRLTGFNYAYTGLGVADVIHKHPVSDEFLVMWSGSGQFFGEAFEDIFEEDSESDSESESESDSDASDDSWETCSFDTQQEPDDWKTDDFYSRYMLAEIVQLQKDYKRAMELGVDFEWYMYNIEYFDVSYEPRVDVFDDIFPHEKNLFVSKYSHTLQNKRSGKRVPSKSDTSYTVVFQVFV